jgi:hypothetical protein
MPAYPRKTIVADDEVGVYHCSNRCVRRAFLCGTDALSGNDYDHRKDWIHEQLQHLASIFAMRIFRWWTGRGAKFARGVRGRFRPSLRRFSID